MTLTFVTQPWTDTSNLDDWFAAVVADAATEPQHVTIVTAWAKRSGLARIEHDVETIRNTGGSVNFILGISEGGATRQGLELALRIADRVDVFHDPGRTFHPKVYLAVADKRATVYSGSGNLTYGGLARNYEAGLVYLTNVQDDAVIMSVEGWVARLRGEVGSCKHLTNASLADILGNVSYRVGDEDGSRSRTVAVDAEAEEDEEQNVGHAVVTVFATSMSRKKGSRRNPGSGNVGGKVGGTSTVPPGGQSSTGIARTFTGKVLRHWSKKLQRSDAQQLGPSSNTNLTGALRLTSSGHPIDRTKYFRYDFFGRELWQADPMRPGVDFTEVDMDVVVLGNPLGVMRFRVDHDITRESGQNNFVTVLKWGSMNALMRQSSYVDCWVVLQELAVAYTLDIVSHDPGTKYPATALGSAIV